MTLTRPQSLSALLAVSALLLVGAGCGGDNNSSSDPATTSAATTTDTTTTATTDTTTTAAASDTIGVKASEMKFVLTSDTAPAGKVTFNAQNVGSVPHEMVIIKTDTPAGKLPTKSNGEVSEKGAIGEIESEKLKVGASASKTFTMKAGHYALICNLPGHYAGGMYSDFTVK